ncbi:MAG: type II/IV secretion system protein [Candidatus Doudnabacteria bacterium]|nr:type II/IV secretion system protein [Candidatus Doudnabacteria bacterium]
MDTPDLLSVLKQKNLVNAEVLAVLQKDPTITNRTWEDALIERGGIKEDQLLQAKSEFLGVPMVDLRNEKIAQDVLQLVPEPIAHRHKVISYAKGKDGLHLAMVDPTDLQTKEFIQKKTGQPIIVHLIGKTSLDFGLSKYHSNLEGEIKHLVGGEPTITTESEKAGGDEIEGLKKMAGEIPVIRVVDTLLEYAIFEKASDIHIEPQETAVTVRYRIDGILHDVMTLPKVIQPALVARIKVLSDLKIDEHRLPQDGRFKVQKDGYKFSLRVSTIPVFDGEKVVMRLLDESTKAMSLKQLGFLTEQLEIVERNIHKPHGMFLVTGPTGSGKSTTLYAVLSILNTTSVNISTIEDPVEYRMERVNQMQVSPKIGLTFAIGLRALLRQDPNVIMIGEIRDAETAEEAVHAAMTGHVVLSTLHTNSAAGALPRLLDIGVEAYLIASTTNAVMAQRLVRVLCPECKQPFKPDAAYLQMLAKQFNLEKVFALFEKRGMLQNGEKKFEDLEFHAPKGCDKCGNSGYKGRIGIHELLEVTADIADQIIQKRTAQEIQETAEKAGMILMWQDGFIKSLEGTTTLDEVLRVSKE